MAITFRAASSGQNATAASTYSVTQPTGAASGDIAIVAISTGANTSFNAVTGWTLDDNLQNGATTSPFTTGVYYRVLDGTESWPISFTSAATGKYAWVCAAWTPGSGNTIHVDGEATPKQDATSATTHTANAQTAVAATVASVIINSNRRQASSATGVTTTPPTGWTEPANGDVTTASGTGTSLAQIATEICYQLGMSGTVTPGADTLSVTASATVFHILLAEVPPPSPGPPLGTLNMPAGTRTQVIIPGTAMATRLQQATAILPGAATITGTGFLSAPVTVQAPATLTGTSFLGTAVTQGAGATLTGTGFLGTAVTQGAGATLTGTGNLTGTAGQGSQLTGQGTLNPLVTQGASAALAGTGFLSATPALLAPARAVPLSQPAGVRVTYVRRGSVLGSPVLASAGSGQGGAAAPTGTGYLSTAVTQGAGATLTGTAALNPGTGTPGPPLGTLNMPAGTRVSVIRAGHAMATRLQPVTAQPGAAVLIAAGFLSAPVTQGAGTALTGTGFLGAAAAQGAGTGTTGAGFLSAPVTQGAGTALTGAGFLSAASGTIAGTGPPLVPRSRPVRARFPQPAPGRAMAIAAIPVSVLPPGTGAASLIGAGFLGTAATQGAGTVLTGTGYLSGTSTTITGSAGPPILSRPQPAGLRVLLTRAGYIPRSSKAPSAPAVPVHSGPFTITLPGGWARVRSGPFTPVLPKPAVTLAGFPGTRSTLAIAIPLPRTAWTGTRLHQPLKIMVANPRTALTGTRLHQPLKIAIPAPRTGWTGKVTHQPLRITVPLPRTSLTGKVTHQPLRFAIPAPRTSLTGKVLHQPLRIVIPAPRTSLAATRLHQPLKIVIPAPRTGWTGFPAHAGPFAIHLGLTRLLRRGATPEDLSAWQQARAATAPVAGRAMSTAPPPAAPGRPGVTASVSRNPRGGSGVS